ncbi:MAG: hypothetical protein E6Q51_02695 [Methylophilus methylotrophus]|uniref:Uncharacterized protein n=1 Tax=Methylophilus methylotrophus TaxID=17 RepID=A0A5C7WL25_METME|nr:MAG: hypothetical protein E6Q51_02695 [Methylophilus methylotrophus]
MKNQHQQTTLENHPEFKETAQVDNLFRLINYNSKQAYDGYYIFEATVFNNQASIRITWIDTTKSTSLNDLPPKGVPFLS